ncbi:putative RNA binding protein [Leptomonas pyrrhocoris]|uniref:Putative RNA binding protein n=1 Tax=Leptomonas pyrrhocoris TaxID=157538 RepID=A0A0N1J5D0_LEPPY|nr:putative RNA binding protein [Leptomonas pyrrhocoris]KPA85564.1 putative RNA binding protein [Leptomonas pyrrhocoris]|eukprot:XP_015664003.1 putative RNA binding protein [Leptomonas pyrrhocoris]
MPSRAVLRRKKHRDAKRGKSGEEGDSRPPSHRITPPHLDDEDGSCVSSSSPRKRSHDALAAPSTLATSLSATPALREVVVAKRARREPPPPPAQMPESLTRKERHRWETSQRLERQMTRLSSTVAAVQQMMGDATAEGAQDAVQLEPKLRHDPKFAHGTFWRDRKEKRARTLFLGGIPSYFTVRQITDLISTVVDSDPNAADYVSQIGKEKDVVEEVDVLPVKHNSKVKHMYVTMASVPLAGCAAAMLDRYEMEGRQLRCNFAADKTQREEAIRRRNTDQR